MEKEKKHCSIYILDEISLFESKSFINLEHENSYLLCFPPFECPALIRLRGRKCSTKSRKKTILGFLLFILKKLTNVEAFR